MSRSSREFHSPWSFWYGAMVLALAMVAFMALSWAHMQIVAKTVGVEAYLGDGQRLPPSVLTIGQFNKALALMGVLAVVGLALKRLDWSSVGFCRVAAGWLVFAALGGVVFFGLRLLLAKWMVVVMPDWLAFAQVPFGFDAVIPWFETAGFLAMTLLITPIVEEVFFRGFMFKWMSGHRPVWVAALVSSALFGISHIIPPQVISAFLMALFLTWLYWRTGSIWPAIVAHVVNNTLGILLGAAALAGGLPAWLTPG